MADQHLVINKKMEEAKAQMKEYATSFLKELIEAEMGKAKEGHETLIKKSFDHQLELEQLRNECNNAIKKMNKFKMKHGNDTKEALELVTQSAEKEKKVKDFEQEIVELKFNLEKMEKRLTDVMGEKGSANNIEANFNAMNASYEQQKQYLDKFEAKLDNVENNTLRKVETIAQQCGETYQKVITANKAIEQDVKALRAIHKAGAKQEETLKVIQKEMKSMLEMLKEFREIKSETMAASLLVQDIQPIPKKLEEAMRKMNHIQSHEELEKEVTLHFVRRQS
jgi:DNA repair ATPase RecN